MKQSKIGKIKNLTIHEDGELEIVFTVTDNKFRKKILRDLKLAGNLKVVGDQIIFVESENDDA